MSSNIFYSPMYISVSMSEREMLSFMANDTEDESEPHHPAYSPITLSPARRSKPTNPTPHPPTRPTTAESTTHSDPDSVAQASVIYLNPYTGITSESFLQAQLIPPHEPTATQSQTTITAAQLIPPHEPAATQSQTTITAAQLIHPHEPAATQSQTTITATSTLIVLGVPPIPPRPVPWPTAILAPITC